MTTKSGFVAIIGKPNAGKSTLMNALLGERLSIITNKPQTTRKRILGILSEEDYQIVFLDTPGILTPSYLLQQKMLEYVDKSVQDADVLVLMIDLSEDKSGLQTFKTESINQILEKYKSRIVIVLNKMDLSEQSIVKDAMEKIKEKYEIENIIPISALDKFNIQSLLDLIIERLPEHPKFYPDDQLTDEPERFFVSEIIREKIFEQYKDEIPYSTEVLIEEFKERENRKDYISASIIVERETQKPIIIGKGGESIKWVGKLSREAIEEFLGREVFLELRVKVRNKWRSNPNMLKNFGYTDKDE